MSLDPPRSKCFPPPAQELNRLASPLASSTMLWVQATLGPGSPDQYLAPSMSASQQAAVSEQAY
jgi:hypothetical protein